MRVECRGLRAITGGVALLDGIDLSFSAPSLIGILGPNGAGKSTLLRCLAGYRAPDSGEVSWDGRSLATWTPPERRSACGYCPQQFEPAWDYSVSEIVALGRDRPFADAVPLDLILRRNGLEDLSTRRWSKLSGGERARTMLAATLSTDPPLVLADEPGASLDMRHRLGLLERLKDHGTRALVIVVMHDLDLALRFCNRLVLLDQGKVAADRAPCDLLSDPNFEAAFRIRIQPEQRRIDRDWVIGVG